MSEIDFRMFEAPDPAAKTRERHSCPPPRGADPAKGAARGCPACMVELARFGGFDDFRRSLAEGLLASQELIERAAAVLSRRKGGSREAAAQDGREREAQGQPGRRGSTG